VWLLVGEAFAQTLVHVLHLLAVHLLVLVLLLLKLKQQLEKAFVIKV